VLQDSTRFQNGSDTNVQSHTKIRNYNRSAAVFRVQSIAITINKSQGQTFNKLGIYLSRCDVCPAMDNDMLLSVEPVLLKMPK